MTPPRISPTTVGCPRRRKISLPILAASRIAKSWIEDLGQMVHRWANSSDSAQRPRTCAASSVAPAIGARRRARSRRTRRRAAVAESSRCRPAGIIRPTAEGTDGEPGTHARSSRWWLRWCSERGTAAAPAAHHRLRRRRDWWSGRSRRASSPTGEAILDLADIGVALLMFSIGLRFSLQRSRSVGRLILIGAGRRW